MITFTNPDDPQTQNGLNVYSNFDLMIFDAEGIAQAPGEIVQV
jgi:hypothetical protein